MKTRRETQTAEIRTDSAVWNSPLSVKNSTTGDQITQYVRGTDVGGLAPQIYRNDLLRSEIYPDSDDPTDLSGDGADAVYDRVEYKYNRQGELIWKKDQNGTIHEFEFDDLARPTADKVTTVGTGVDNGVLRIGRTYEVRGMVEKITSYDAATAGTVLGQVFLERDAAGFTEKEYQEHDGGKGGSTPYVHFSRDTTATGGEFTKGLRPTSLRYPNGRLVHFGYGTTGSMADILNRLDAIKEDSGGSPGNSLTEYEYLSTSSVIQVNYPEPDLRYDLAHGGGNDPYDGPADRFGRVTDLQWYDYGSSIDAVRIQHGFDRASNRLYRGDPVAAVNGQNFDELYTYDGINQLTDFDRGNLNANQDGLVAASMNFAQEWSLDPTGNWTAFKQDDDGNTTWDLNQPRTHNKANEITQIGGSSAYIAHDRTGNMTKIPQPDDWSDDYDLTYDAWNRLVKVMDDAATLAEYAYDGRNRRTDETISGTTRHFYYSAAWQCLEERLDASTDPDRQFVWGLDHVDDLLLRDRDTSEPKNGTLDERFYALQDANWNVVALADTGGDIQERYAYTAYGVPEYLTASFASRNNSDYEWEVLYGGYRFDADTGVYQVRHRMLAPEFGWLQRDPLGLASDVNLFRYVANAPVNHLDPLGLIKSKTVRTLIGEFCRFNSLYGTTRNTDREPRHQSAECVRWMMYSMCRREHLRAMAIGAKDTVVEVLTALLPLSKAPKGLKVTGEVLLAMAGELDDPSDPAQWEEALKEGLMKTTGLLPKQAELMANAFAGLASFKKGECLLFSNSASTREDKLGGTTSCVWFTCLEDTKDWFVSQHHDFSVSALCHYTCCEGDPKHDCRCGEKQGFSLFQDGTLDFCGGSLGWGFEPGNVNDMQTKYVEL